VTTGATTAATESTGESTGTTATTTTGGVSSTTDGETTGATATTDATTDGCPPGDDGCPCLPGDLCADALVCVGAQCEPPPPDTCGDGVVDVGESCDDGNDVDHDGCTQQCTATRALAIAVGGLTPCALLSGGALRCWGGNPPGKPGYPGVFENIGDDEPPADYGPVELGGPAVDVAVGGGTVCARMTDGDLRCWGNFTYGQHGLGHAMLIGDDEHPYEVAPVMIGGPVAAVSSRHLHSCALLEGGAVRCWGSNNNGQLGYGHNKIIGDNEHPASQAEVMLGEPAVQVGVGWLHTCALLESGAIRCWGTNSSGQIGLGKSGTIGLFDHPSDHPAIDLPDVEEIAVGHYHNCIRQSDGAVRCWGDNGYGQLGYGHTQDIGDNEPIDDIPVVSLGAPATRVFAGNYMTCAILEGGDLRCWGYNYLGQLGLGHLDDIGDDELPSDVPPIDIGGPVVDVAMGHRVNCALLEGGAVRCWGYGDSGLGYGDTETIGDNEHPSSKPAIVLY
jgi:cysteine-rich repeat protein